jgi:hypothetical protein
MCEASQLLQQGRTRWIRVTSVGKFTDVHGELKKAEADALAERLEGAKVVAARDEKKALLCWSIVHGLAAPEGASSRLLGEIRSFSIVQLLLADGWMLGPEGSIHNETIMFHP